MRRKTIIVTVAVIFIAFMLFIINGFYGNPITAYYATQANVRYIMNKYPELKLEVGKARYTVKDSEYVSLVESPNLIDVHFTVSYKNGKTRYDSYNSDVLTGYNTEKRFGQERTDEIKPLLIAKYEDKLKGRCFVDFVEQFDIKEDKVKINQPYYKEFRCKTKLFADFSLDTVTPEAIATHVIELNKFLVDRGYVIDKFIGDYSDSEKHGYSVSIRKEMINSSLDDSIEKALSDRDNMPYDKLSIYKIQ